MMFEGNEMKIRKGEASIDFTEAFLVNNCSFSEEEKNLRDLRKVAFKTFKRETGCRLW